MKPYRNLKSNIFIFFIPLFLFLNLFGISSAATLNFSPSSGTYANGSTFSVNIVVSSTDQDMNTVSGVVSFPSDLLSVSSISKSGSIIRLWVQEPSFSNNNGTINFEGTTLDTAYKGSSGRILTVVFKTKVPGIAKLSYISGLVLAADGTGKDITTGTDIASYQISKENVDVPSAPKITSSTHPDQNSWYPLKDANFSWVLSKDAINSRILIGRNAKAIPTVVYDLPINSKEVKDLPDGVLYFHAQLQNDSGWGAISDFRLQIDTENPTSFDITQVNGTNATDTKAAFIFSATDKTSGIDHYEIQIDNGNPEIWKDDGSHTYTAPTMNGGNHTLSAKAVDKAGNFLVKTINFFVKSSNSLDVKSDQNNTTNVNDVSGNLSKTDYWTINVPKVPTTVAAVLGLIALGIFSFWFIFFRVSRNTIYRAFKLLLEGAKEHIKILEDIKMNRSLTDEEIKINLKLKKDLQEVDTYIKREISDIKNLIKTKK